MASHESNNGVNENMEKAHAASAVPRSIPGDQRKVALITGITGQDGSYLTEFLLGKGDEVHCLIRLSSDFDTYRLDHLYVYPHNAAKARMKLHYADLSDASSLRRWVDALLPDEVYNLAAQSHVAVSFEIPDYTTDVVATGALRLHEAVRCAPKPTRYYQAGSSEMFGSTPPPSRRPPPSTHDPPSPLCGCQGRRPLVHRQLPRGLRALRLQRHSPQPREPPSRRELCDPQDHPRRPDEGLPREPVGRLGLRLRRRLRGDNVDDAAAGGGGGLRGGDGGVPQGGRVPAGCVRLRRAGVEGACGDRSPVLPAGGSGQPEGRLEQGEEGAGVEAQGGVP